MAGQDHSALDLDRLLRLRLVVARVGEMDVCRWWNTSGLLGRQGRVLLSRGLPRTCRFAQARTVLAVATQRCHELFDPPGCMTLWSLPAEVEDRLDAHWHQWLERADEWEPFFASLETIEQPDLLEALRTRGLVEADELEVVSRLQRSFEGRAVPLPGTYSVGDAALTLLAAGFVCGEIGKPAIPYARLEDA